MAGTVTVRCTVTIRAKDGHLRFEPYDYYNNHTGVQKLVYALLQLHLLKNEWESPLEHMYWVSQAPAEIRGDKAETACN